MLGKCDAVHSGAAMAFVAVGIVGLTVVSTLGLMGYFQVPNGSLAKKIGEANGEAVETQKMIKDNKYNKLKRRSQEKSISSERTRKLKTDEQVNSKDCIFKRRDFHVLFFQIRTSGLNERKEIKVEHNQPIMEIFPILGILDSCGA